MQFLNDRSSCLLFQKLLVIRLTIHYVIRKAGTDIYTIKIFLLNLFADIEL